MADEVEYVIKASSTSLFNWLELWKYRELFYFFTWRDIKVRYKQTVLGFLWALLQPLVMMLIFTFFFGQTLQVPSQGLPYPVFVFSGLLLWNTFSSGLANAANSMINSAGIVKKIYFPRLILPTSAILVALFDFLMAFVLLMGILVYYRQPVSFNAIIYWPFAILVCIVATLGPGSWLAALNVKYRDFRYIIPFLTQALFFMTPVLYPISLLSHPILKYVLIASPMYAAIELFRFPITGLELNWLFIGISLSSTCILLLIGLIYFRKTEDFFADFS